MPRLTSGAEAVAIRVVIVTMDDHLAAATERAQARLKRDLPGLTLSMHTAAVFGENPEALAACKADIARADILIATMLFIEDHIQAVLPDLKARREQCDAVVACMSAGEVTKLTRLGRFVMGGPESTAMSLLKKLRGKPSSAGGATAGAKQMKMLRRIPQILKFIPGAAQDVRAYFLSLQYWLAGSDENLVNLIRMLIDRYADGPRKVLRGHVSAAAPVEYPEVGVYHPRVAGRIADSVAKLPATKAAKGTIGLLVMRSYLLADNARHYDGVIEAFEARGFNVIPAFSSGLDARPAIERFFMDKGRPTIDAMVSLTGFSLVGGPAYNDAKSAEDILGKLDIPYVAAHPVEFQTLDQWGGSDRGLMPVESTIMVSIPELDGSIAPTVFGGRAGAPGAVCKGCERHCKFDEGNHRDMHSCIERTAMLADRVARMVALRKTQRAERRIAAVIFNFPPNAGNTGTAAYLGVFESLYHTLETLKREGYTVEMPASVDALRAAIIEGNAKQFGAVANVHHRIAAEDHVRRERYLSEIEGQWGPAPGRQQSDGQSIFVLGARFGNVFVGVQPGFGYEGDPMRLLFERGFAPTHAFSAFYRWLREDFAAHAVLHFGTHGALEFMPGKQVGLTAMDWPDRLIGDLPNFYLYASNNPSEGTIAKRRSAATLISYMTPPIAQAGLYRGLLDLKSSLERWRGTEPDAVREREELAVLIQAQAAAVELAKAEPAWGDTSDTEIGRLTHAVLELEYTLIPHGLHVVGEVPTPEERTDMLAAVAESAHGRHPAKAAVEALVRGVPVAEAAKMAANDNAADLDAATALALFEQLAETDRLLVQDFETPAIIKALDARFIAPAPGGDLLRSPQILPTGRNIHGFDPFRIPSVFALKDGARQAERVLARHLADHGKLPESVAIVLWGTDNLKSEGGPIAQALALMGAKPRFDSYGRLAGAELMPLAELGRPRIDAMMTLSGIFRDLLPLQTRLLAEASWLAASAEEDPDQNFVRKHALAYMAAKGCDLETAALRVFSNADGAYGSNVNLLIDSGAWNDEDELADAYQNRKCFAYGRNGKVAKQAEILDKVLSDVEMTYQNLESVELGITTLDQYFDTLGGISRAVRRASGADVAVYIGDQTRGEGTVRTLGEQVALETRTRALNPKWYEGMLKHGYEGVRQIEQTVTNTMGWSATTGQVAPWIYQQLTETFVLDPAMRDRLAALNPTATARVANRLIEAHERNYWTPDAATLAALRAAGEDLEDRLEGVGPANAPKAMQAAE
jgi:magnesium chelatase subunit H